MAEAIGGNGHQRERARSSMLSRATGTYQCYMLTQRGCGISAVGP